MQRWQKKRGGRYSREGLVSALTQCFPWLTTSHPCHGGTSKCDVIWLLWPCDLHLYQLTGSSNRSKRSSINISSPSCHYRDSRTLVQMLKTRLVLLDYGYICWQAKELIDSFRLLYFHWTCQNDPRFRNRIIILQKCNTKR